MPTTTNFGWTTPADTDLVKDGAAAIRTLGSAIDTSLVDLKGGTTGQVLAKASNADLDFTWAADASGIPATIFDAKGDLIAASAADTAARLAVGTNGQVLTADSTTSTGLKWATPSSGPTGYTLLNAGGTNLTGATTITVSGISAKSILVIIDGASAGADAFLSFRLNGDTGLNYTQAGNVIDAPSTYSTNDFQGYGGYSGSDGILFAQLSSNGGSTAYGSLLMDLTDTSGWKAFTAMGGANASTGNGQRLANIQGIYEASAAITSVSVVSDSGNFDAGKIYVLGAN